MVELLIRENILNCFQNNLIMIKNYVQSIFNKAGYIIRKKPRRVQLKTKVTKFDFVIFSGGRTGSKALQFFLNQHPQIYIISRKELDFALKSKGNGIKDLINSFSGTLNILQNINIKCGIVIHNHIDSLKPETISALSAICKKGIFVVRNPMDVIQSCKRHLFYYSINPIAYKLFEFGHRNKPLCLSDYSENIITAYKKNFAKHLSSLSYLEHAENIKKKFSNLITFKFEDIIKPNGFEKLIKFVGCDIKHKVDLSYKVNNSIERYLRHNQFNLTLPSGAILKCRLGTTKDTIYHTDDENWMTLNFKFKNAHKMFNSNSFFLSVYLNDYLALSKNEILFLHKYMGKLFDNLIQEKLASLSKGISHVETLINKLISRNITEDLEKKILSLYEKDYMSFYRKYF